MYSKKFKKLSAIVLASILSVNLIACTSGNGEEQEENSTSVETQESGEAQDSESTEESKEAAVESEETKESTQEESKETAESLAESSEEVVPESSSEEVASSSEEKAEVTPVQEEGYKIADFEIPDTEGLRFVADMKIGWNLGNTFDAKDCTWLSNDLDYESAWCGVKTTRELIDEIKAAGFNTVRVPVSWHDHLNSDNTIDEAWLNRVNEVVDYCIDNDMYVILNIHHDNDTNHLYPSSQYLDQSRKYVENIWQQLSVRFMNYDNHLIFEAMNEPRLVGHNNEWWLDPNNADCQDAIKCINVLNQAFVDVVRASGGNNASRYLLCPGYCAAPDGVLNSNFVLPSDPANRIILEVHAYTPYNFALENPGTDTWSSKNARNASDMVSFMNDLYKKYVANGIPVVIDEFGAMEKNGNIESRADFAGYYIANARARGITCVWWDNNVAHGDGERFGLIDRASLTWVYPEIVEAMMKYAQ